MWCFGLILIMFCDSHSQSPVSSDFCVTYQKIIQSPLGSVEVKKLATGEKKRVEANEILYRCKCEGWQSPLCPKAE